ncbi:MAG: hypothetical protein ACLUFA_03735 [[Clostridium] leptum]
MIVIVSPTKYHCEIAVCAAKHRRTFTGKTRRTPGNVRDHGAARTAGDCKSVYAPVVKLPAAKKAVEAGEIGCGAGQIPATVSLQALDNDIKKT